jgi:hypothetical protein
MQGACLGLSACLCSAEITTEASMTSLVAVVAHRAPERSTMSVINWSTSRSV